MAAAKPWRGRGPGRALVLRALLLFAALLAADGVAISWLFLQDFHQRTVRSKLAETAACATSLAENITREIAPAGSIDFPRIVARPAALDALIARCASDLKRVQFVDVLDPEGRLVVRRRPDDAGGWSFQIAGAFGGEAPPNPDTAPTPLSVDEGRPSRTTGGAAVRTVPVPLQAGAGTLLFGVTAAPLEEEVARLRRTLVRRLALGGAVSLVLLSVAFLFVLRLIQRTRRSEADAQRAEQLAYLGTLASGLAHEIRNPLNAMNINLQMLEEELDERRLPEPTLELLRSSRGEVLRLERLVKDFLAFARPQTRRREQVAPAAMVAEVIRFVRPLFGEAKVQLELVQEPGAPVVWIDSGQVRQALLNILQNALEVSPPGGSVTVVVGATPHGEARIEVRDQGPGIPHELRPLVFEVFWSRKPAGSGLGLPIALRAVEAHGGSIEIDSKGGAGSVFRIILPPAITAAAAAPPAPPPPERAP